MRVSRLTIYPLKSAAGISLDRMVLDDLGPQLDRRWMLIDDTGRFISQREEAKLALVTTALSGETLCVAAPGRESLRITAADWATPRIKATVWDDVVDVVPMGSTFDEWFSDVLETSCRLVYFPDDSTRPAERAFNPDNRQIGFADGFPLLVISESSLTDLNDRLIALGREVLPMNRFRPNLVVDGCPAFAEDSWRDIQVGGDDGIRLSIVKPCARCSITTVDQATGVRGKEPLATLAKYRRGSDGSVFMGQNAIHDRPGDLAIGDEVRVLAAGASNLPS